MHTSSTLSRPSGPPSKTWGIHHLGKMRRDYLGFVQTLQAHNPDIAHVQILNEHVTHVFHPEWVREILVDQSQMLSRWERATDVFSISMGQSVLVTEGDRWQRQRRMLQPGFTPKRVAGYSRLMTDATQQTLSQLSIVKNTQTVDMDALMTHMTLDVILRTLFGQHQNTNTTLIAQAIQTLSHYGYLQFFQPFSWPMWMPLPAVRQARQALTVLNRLIQSHIQARSEKIQDDTLLSMLQQVRDPERPVDGLSPQELHDQTMVIFQAGHETTATALTWWSGLMARHPDIAGHIQEEVDEVLQGQLPTPDALMRMPWLQASLKEALRLYPPAAILFTRRTCQDIAVGPWTIPKGELIAFTPYVIQRNSRWFESPDDFRPARFLSDAPDIQRGAWIPFGVGPRVCIGQHFAMLEMGVIAAMLLQRFQLVWPSEQAWPQTNLAVSLRPATMMRVQLVNRN